MDFYHGSTVGGLTELRPSTSWYSNLKEPTVGTMKCIKTYIYNKSPGINSVKLNDAGAFI